MDTSVLSYVFTISIIIGFVIPLISIIMGSFGDLLSFDADIDVDLDVDIDVDVNVDGASGGLGLIPFNMLCLCLLLVVFGAVGHMLKKWMSSLGLAIALTAAAVVVGAVFYWLMYKFVVKKLKKSTVPAISYDDLCGEFAEVTLRISGDSMGTISLLDSTGTFVSFRAKKDPDLADRMEEVLKAGQKVMITEVDKKEKICYVTVSPAEFVSNKFE